jgi:hypothetical protein
VQNEILVKNPKADIHVYAVWEPVLGGDSSGAWDPQVLNDPRVINYWDPKLLMSTWLDQHVTHSGSTVWDHYFIYGPSASWQSMPGPLVGSGGDVIDVSGELRNQVDSLIG